MIGCEGALRELQRSRQLSSASSSSSIVTICAAPKTGRQQQQAASSGFGGPNVIAMGQPVEGPVARGPQLAGVAQEAVGKPTLVDLLIDSQLDWRQLIAEANPHCALTARLSESQIKRQEVIHELIQTERHHCLTLALMRQVYLSGLLRLNEFRQHQRPGAGTEQPLGAGAANAQQLNQEPVDIERLFPALEELIQAHELFFAHLRLRLVDSCAQPASQPNKLVGLIGPLGDLLIEQFKLHADHQDQDQEHERDDSTSAGSSSSSSLQRRAEAGGGDGQGRRWRRRARYGSPAPAGGGARQQTNGARLLQAYAKFCGQHYESSRYFKQLMQSDKGFRQFIEQCNKQHPACRQRGIPECNLLVAQRLTKYPLLIEQLIKTSKEEPDDEAAKLARALGQCRAILAELNAQLARKESFERLLHIYAHFSPKSSTIFYRKQPLKFTKHDLLQHKRLRRLLHADDQVRLWSAVRRKLVPALCLVLDDIVVFLRAEPTGCSSSSSAAVGGAERSASLSGGGGGAGSPGTGLMQPMPARHLEGEPQGSPAELLADLATPQPNMGGAGVQARYYFANVDNKSSVISLSKLLIREKAVEEAEPRIYLIASSPGRPEMYELAFSTRRHQRTFVDKLEGAIEGHNRAKLSSLAAQLGEAELLGMSSESLSSCCSSLLAEDDGDDDDDEEEEVERAARIDENDSASSCSAGSGPQQAKTRKPEVVGDEDLDELRLDIEQALVPEPRELGHSRSSSPVSSSSGAVGLEEAALSPTISSHSNATGGATSDGNSKTPASAPAPGQLEELEAGSGRTSCSPPPSGGLCERARDSCDEAPGGACGAAAGAGETNGRPLAGAKLKLKAGRRRRAQRPRQASNQSSCSDSGNSSGTANTSESIEPGAGAAKAGDEDLDSGRGQDSSASSALSSSSSSSSTAGGSDSLTLPSTVGEGDVKLDLSNASSQQATGRPKEAEGARGEAGSTVASAPKAAVGKLARKCELANKARKLSTVSSISNQMKLIQRLRSVGLLDSASSAGGSSSSPPPPANIHEHQEGEQLLGSLGSGARRRLLQQQLQLRRRSLFIPEQKLEELRNLRIKLDKDKQEWQEKFDRMQEQLLNERRELDLAREKLRQERRQVEDEREQLFRKLDLLKENGILLSPSHKIIITGPPAQQRQQQQVYSISQHQHWLHMDQQHRLAVQQQQQQQQQRAPQSRVPLYLSQQAPARPLQPNAQQVQHVQQQQQQQQQRQCSGRVPFIGALPGASFLVRRFASGAAPAPEGQQTGAGLSCNPNIIQAQL